MDGAAGGAMKILAVALGVVGASMLTAAVATAEPIVLSVNGGSGFTADPGSLTSGTSTLNLGTISLNGASSAEIYVDGLSARQDYTVTFDLIDPSGSGFTVLTAEILDPLSDGFDAMDAPQPSYVPDGFSTSNNTDGLSFAWNSGLARSATFAG